MVGTGANRQTFYVYRDLLSFYSGYFKAALNGSFAEANTGIIRLATEEPAVFTGFVKWLYTHKHRADKITDANDTEYYMSIVKLWIFADRRDVPLLMNEMVDLFQQSMVASWILPSGTIKEIYNNTTQESALRRMVVDMHASLSGCGTRAHIPYNSKFYTQNFLIDLFKSLVATSPRRPRLSQEQYKKVEMCPAFHVHEEGVKCTKKGTKRSSDEMEK